MSTISSSVTITSDTVPSFVRTSVNPRNLVPGEFVSLWKALHTLQTKQVNIEQVCILTELANLKTEWDSIPVDPVLDSGDVDVVCHVCL